MMYHPDSLFDPRGGSLMAQCCEVCSDDLEDDTASPVCPDCSTQEEDE